MEEIEDLCFKFGVKADNLDGRNASAKARNLILYAQRRKLLTDLLALCQELRPELDWPEYSEPEPRPRPAPRPKQSAPPQTATSTATAAPSTPLPKQPKTEPQAASETTKANDSLTSKMKSWLQKLRGG